MFAALLAAGVPCSYNEMGMALLRPLAPGDTTWPELLEAAEKQKAAEASAESALAAATLVSKCSLGLTTFCNVRLNITAVTNLVDHSCLLWCLISRLTGCLAVLHSLRSQLMSKLDGQGVLATDSVAGQPAASGQPAAAPTQADTAATSVAGMPADTATATAVSTEQAAPSAAPLVVVLFGPPLAGTSTQASLLSSRYGLPVITVDYLLHEAYRLQQEQAAEAAAVAAAADAPPSPGSTQKRQLLDQLSKLLFAQPEQAIRPTSPTGRVQSASKTRGASAGAHADSQQHHLSVPEVVTAALQMALQQEQYSKGYIVDGLSSKHLSSAAVAARCLMMAVGLTCKALQQPELPPPPLPASAAKGVKAPSRPPSSRPGAKGVAVPEPVPPILTFAGPDVWEGTQQVCHCLTPPPDLLSHKQLQTCSTLMLDCCSVVLAMFKTIPRVAAVCLLQVHVVELKLTREEAARRHEAAAAAAAAGLEVADLGAEASQGLLGEASFMPEQQQQQQSGGQVSTGCLDQRPAAATAYAAVRSFAFSFPSFVPLHPLQCLPHVDSSVSAFVALLCSH